MQLLRLEMKGFKSFADKTIVTFSPGMTAIVGPNGSGKSNITDAIRWVLGESNVRNLRGQKAEDIIFSGTEQRKPMSAAEVSLVFDNSDGTLQENLSEVVITRRIYRSGESEFFINKRHCRLKDIHLLLADTGLGRDSMAIIGQNRIDAILNSKPEERRLIFEDVAGISRFKMSKEEARRRMDHTNRNMERLGDLMANLNEQLVDLEEKANKTKEFMRLSREKRDYDGALAFHEYKTADRLFTKQENEWISLTREQEVLEEELSRMEVLRHEKQDRLQTLRDEQTHIDEEYQKHQEQVVRLEGQIELHSTRRNQVEQELQHLDRQREQLLVDLEGTAQFLSIHEALQETERDALRDFHELVSEKEQALEKAITNLQREEHAIKVMQDEDMERQKIAISLVRDREKYAQEVESLASRIEEEQVLIETIRAELEDVVKRGQYIDEELTLKESETQKVREELEAVEATMHENNNRRNKLQEQRSAVLRELQYMEGRLQILQTWEEQHEGYMEGTKKVIEAKESWSTGIIGPVGDLFTVDKRFITAIDISLGAAIQHVVTRTTRIAGEAVTFLKRNQGGRVTFLPLDTVKGKRMDSLALQEEGVLGRAVDCIAYKDEYDAIFSYLLGRTIVVDTLENAMKIQKKYNHTLRLITLEGEQFHPGGSLTGGIQKKKKATLLRRREEQEMLACKYEREQVELVGIEKELKDVEERILSTSTEVESLKDRAHTVTVHLHGLETAHKTNLEEQYRKKSIVSRSEEQIKSLELLKEEANRRFTKVQKDLETHDDARDLGHGLSEKMEALHALREQERLMQQDLHKKQLEGEQLRLGIEHRQQQIEERIVWKRECEEELKSVERQLQEKREVLHDLLPQKGRDLDELLKSAKASLGVIHEKRTTSLAIMREEEERLQASFEERTRVDERLKTVQRKLIQMQEGLMKYRLNGERALELLSQLGFTKEEGAQISPTGNVQQWKARQGELESLIDGLGPVNPNGVAEFEEAQERLSFYESQLYDLQTAKDQLEDVICEIDKAMSTQLQEVLQVVRIGFQRVFSELFGGGTAQVVLTDEEHILESGIDFYIQPPGKKRQQLTLLSGGERALTVIALLFSFLDYRPAPFCVLDEVDAALDEANVERFSSYLHNLNKETQFIVVSHRKRTMESAEVLQGVTMAERGISRLLTVTFDEVKEEPSYGI